MERSGQECISYPDQAPVAQLDRAGPTKAKVAGPNPVGSIWILAD